MKRRRHAWTWATVKPVFWAIRWFSLSTFLDETAPMIVFHQVGQYWCFFLLFTIWLQTSFFFTPSYRRPHIRTVWHKKFNNNTEQRTIIQQYGVWYTGRWWVSCYIWYSEEGAERAGAPPSFLLAVPNVTAHPSTVSVGGLPTSY